MHVNITIKSSKITSRKCHNQENCKGVSQSNGLQGVSQSKGLPETATFKMTSKGYHNQYDCEGVSLLKGISRGITNKMTASEYNKVVISCIYNNENDYK